MNASYLKYPEDAYRVAMIATQLAPPGEQPVDDHFNQAMSILESADHHVWLRRLDLEDERKKLKELGKVTFEDLLAENSNPQESDYKGYNLRCMSVTESSKIPTKGRSLVVVSLLRDDDGDPDSGFRACPSLVIRIFDASGCKVYNLFELATDSSGKTPNEILKNWLLTLPCSSEPNLSQEEKEAVIKSATSIAGYKLSRRLGFISNRDALRKKIRKVFANAEEHDRFGRFNPDPALIEEVDPLYLSTDEDERFVDICWLRGAALKIPVQKRASLLLNCRPAEDIIKSRFMYRCEIRVISQACRTRKRKSVNPSN